METQGTIQEISYQIDCPDCGETSYSDINTDEWDELEQAEGHPFGVLKCPFCGVFFEMSIES